MLEFVFNVKWIVIRLRVAECSIVKDIYQFVVFGPCTGPYVVQIGVPWSSHLAAGRSRTSGTGPHGLSQILWLNSVLSTKTNINLVNTKNYYYAVTHYTMQAIKDNIQMHIKILTIKWCFEFILIDITYWDFLCISNNKMCMLYITNY